MMLSRALWNYEVTKHRLLASILAPGDIMIDVGANKGDFAIHAANLVGITGEVIAFEPEPQNCKWIRESIRINEYSNLRLFPVALSDKNGLATFYLGEKSGWNSLKQQGPISSQTIQVEQRRLDDLLVEQRFGRSIKLIKIDVEGAESEVLNGAQETLQTMDATLLIDLHPHLGVDVKRLQNRLREFGYEIFHEDSAFHRIVKPHEHATAIIAAKS